MSKDLTQADEIEVLLSHSWSTTFSALSDLRAMAWDCARQEELCV